MVSEVQIEDVVQKIELFLSNEYRIASDWVALKNGFNHVWTHIIWTDCLTTLSTLLA